MIEALLRIALNEKSELHKAVSLSLKILLTLITSIKLYSLWLGDKWVYHLPDVGQFVQWIISGDLVIGIGLYFSVWFIFYGFVSFILYIVHLWLWSKVDNPLDNFVTAIKTAPAEELLKIKIFSLLKRIGFLEATENRIKAGWIILNFANDLKLAKNQSEDKQIIEPFVDLSLLIHFIVLALFVASIWLLPWWLLLICFILCVVLLIIGFFVILFRFLIAKYYKQLLSLCE